LSDAYALQAANDAVAFGELFRPFLESLPWPFIFVDEQGLVVHASQTLARGRPGVRSPLSRPMSEAFPEFFAALRGEPRWLSDQNVRVERLGHDGPLFEDLLLRRLPWGACLLVVDQSRQRERDAADAQTARLASLGFMVAGVSHELSNPLAAIYSMVQILQSNKDIAPETLQIGLANIASNVKRMLDISRRLVGFSRAGDEPRAALRIDEAIDEALAVLRQDRQFASISIKRRAEPRAVILGNHGQIQAVFYNLFINAAQAMQGQGQLAVETRLDPIDGVEVAVSDTGPGIPAAILPRIFEPFFTTKPAGQGTGLGLSISNEIAHEHGGTIRADVSAAPGACIRVRLPLFAKPA